MSYERSSNVVPALSKHPDACVMVNARMPAFLNMRRFDLDAYPLTRYIHENFKGVTARLRLCGRKERDLMSRDLAEPAAP